MSQFHKSIPTFLNFYNLYIEIGWCVIFRNFPYLTYTDIVYYFISSMAIDMATIKTMSIPIYK